MNDLIANILNKIPETNDPEDKVLAENLAKRYLNAGWSPVDIVKFIMCIENFNPDLDESIALSRMAAIRSKYES